MIPLYSDYQFGQARNKDLLPLSCYRCNNTFYRTKTYIKSSIKLNKKDCKYCSYKCHNQSRVVRFSYYCKQCNKIINKIPRDTRKSKSGNLFCSKSCSASYNNTHKTHGCRRSKIEIWLEEQLLSIYSNLEISFNDKTIIGSELDIYIPSLSLAFELNGVFHYEPIYGNNKLKQIQLNDKNKFFLCQQHDINLCIIDISQMIHFKPLKAQKFLDIILSIINQNLSTPSRT